MDENEPNHHDASESEKLNNDPDFDSALDCFADALDSVLPNLKLSIPDGQENLRQLAKLMDIDPGESNNLHHYTTAEGIQGIVEKGQFHASAAYFLNDSSEIDYGCQLFAEILHKFSKEREEETTLGPVVLSRMSTVFHDLTPMRNQLSKTYVVCFCEKPNLLSQWRAYGQSGGYSIGFDREALKKFRTEGNLCQVSLKKVIYAEPQQNKILRNIADSMSQLGNGKIESKFNKLTKKAQVYCVRICGFAFQRIALGEIVRFKHPAFEEEKEWRLIAQPKGLEADEDKFINTLKFRASRGVPMPYIELMPEGKLLPITSVQYGPTLERKRVEHALNVLFRKHGYGEIRIAGSEIPIRL
jgi:hypothetical protein